MRKRLMIAVLTAAFLVCAATASAQRALPAKAKTPVARKIRDKRIERHRQRYLAKSPTIRSAKKLAAEKKITKLASQINAVLSKTPPKKPILIILEGSDGAGKSSTTRRILPAFNGARDIETAHFGAPPPGLDGVEKVMRYFASVPSHEKVMIWDRSWYGRAVFNPDGTIRSDTKSAKARIKQINHMEGALKGEVEIVKFFLSASKDRQAQTLGKREARAPEKLGDADYLAYSNRKQVNKLFKNAIDKTGKHAKWHVINMDDRSSGRIEMLKVLKKTVENLGEQQR